MFITNNHTLFHLWCKENLVLYQKISKYYDHDCNFLGATLVWAMELNLCLED